MSGHIAAGSKERNDTIELSAGQGDCAVGGDGDNALVGGEGLWGHLKRASRNDAFVLLTTSGISSGCASRTTHS